MTEPSFPKAHLRALLMFLAPMAALELCLLASDTVGSGALRDLLTLALGVWPQIWAGADGVYPGQGVLMLVTYSLLHSDPVHFAFNAVFILIFGRLLLAEMRMSAFVAAFLASAAAGAVAYIVLSSGQFSAVGASGGAYGLAGLWAGQFMRLRKAEAGNWRPVIGVLGAMVAITLIMPIQSYGIAWQAHFGGAALGLAIGWYADRTPGAKTSEREKRDTPHLRVVHDKRG